MLSFAAVSVGLTSFASSGKSCRCSTLIKKRQTAVTTYNREIINGEVVVVVRFRKYRLIVLE